MKSFKQYISEDIIGGYHEGQPEYIKHGRSKKIESLDELVSRIGRNYTPGLNTDIVPLDDNFNVHLNRSLSGDFITAHVISRKPGHEGTSLMSYSLSKDYRNKFITPDGRETTIFTGTPMKTMTNVKRGVFKSPRNLIHTIVNHYGVSVISGGTQTPGGINMWRRAVRHGHETGHNALRVQEIGGTIRSFGEITPRNFSDAYTGDVSAKKTGNKSKVLRGSVRDVIADENAPEERKKLGNRAESRLLVHPK